MRRKQLYAIILAGALAASSAPAAVFAAEGDVAATAETSEENPVDGETAAATEAPAEQAPAQEAAAATEAPAQEAAPSEQTQQTTEETAAVQETPAADDAAIRPEFKKAMDSYETFFGEFVEFMQLLSDDPSNLTLMAKYADYMSQYTETMEALENIDESELTASELSYYIGVMSRIQQMVLAAVG